MLLQYYHRHYHLRYVHAKKLLIFDLVLLSSIAALIGLTFFWLWYDPTIRSSIILDIHLSSDAKIKSGETVEFDVYFKNKSSIRLLDAKLSLLLPTGFISSDVTTSTYPTASLHELDPNEAGTYRFHGLLYGTPDKPIHPIVALSYRQEHRLVREEKIAALILTPRGSILIGQITTPTTTLAGSSFPIRFTVKNTSETTLDEITVPLSSLNRYGAVSLTADKGNITPHAWQIAKLEGGEEISLSGVIQASEEIGKEQPMTLSLTPEIVVGQTPIPQITLSDQS